MVEDLERYKVRGQAHFSDRLAWLQLTGLPLPFFRTVMAAECVSVRQKDDDVSINQRFE